MKIIKRHFISHPNLSFIIAALCFFSSCSYFASRVINLKDLPIPNGKYSIGTKIYTWTDESRYELFTPELSNKRKIVVQIWYPVEKSLRKKTYYLDNPNQRVKPIANQFIQTNVSPRLVSLLLSDVKNIKTNSEYNAEVKFDSSIKYPLIIFSHGLGGMKNQNSIQVEELVSRGYVVVAPDHSYDANITIFDNNEVAPFKSSDYDPDAKYTIQDFYNYRIPQIQTRSADLSFIIDKIEKFQLIEGDDLWNIIDLDKIGVFGHSFGGGTSLVTAYNDNRIDASLALDGWIEPVPNEIINKGSSIPFLYIGRVEWEDTLNYYKLDKLIKNSNSNAEKIILPGTKHFDYTDTPYFHKMTKTIRVSGTMPTIQIIDTLNYHLVKFFDEKLKVN